PFRKCKVIERVIPVEPNVMLNHGILRMRFRRGVRISNLALADWLPSCWGLWLLEGRHRGLDESIHFTPEDRGWICHRELLARELMYSTPGADPTKTTPVEK